MIVILLFLVIQKYLLSIYYVPILYKELGRK